MEDMVMENAVKSGLVTKENGIVVAAAIGVGTCLYGAARLGQKAYTAAKDKWFPEKAPVSEETVKAEVKIDVTPIDVAAELKKQDEKLDGFKTVLERMEKVLLESHRSEEKEVVKAKKA